MQEIDTLPELPDEVFGGGYEHGGAMRRRAIWLVTLVGLVTAAATATASLV